MPPRGARREHEPWDSPWEDPDGEAAAEPGDQEQDQGSYFDPLGGERGVRPPAMSSKERAEAEARIHGLVDRAHASGQSTAGKDAATKPLVDPPEFGDRIRDLEKKPFWIPGAFPTIFQNETGDPYNWHEKEPELTTWGPHVMRSRGWIAQAHMTFMYWWFNMVTRFKALSAKKWYVRDNPPAMGYTSRTCHK